MQPITSTPSPTNPTKPSTTFSLKPTPKIPGLSAPTTVTQFVADTTITRPKELVSDLIHQATKCVLASGSKAGKTWLLLYLALCVATGAPFLRWATAMGIVLYINLELQLAFIKDRLDVLMKHLGITAADNLHLWNLRGKTADFDALTQHLIKQTEGKGYALIIIDPIYKAMIGRSENTAAGVGMLCHQIERIAERSGAAVVYAHHFTKGDAKKKSVMDRMSGSGVFARDADTILTLTEHTEPNCYTLETILRNLPSQPSFVVEWHFPVMVERDDLDPEDVVAEDVEDENDHGVMALLEDKPLSSGEWQVQALGLGVSRATFYRIKSELRTGGYVGFDMKTKTWSLVDKGGGKTGETRETGEAAVGEAGGVVQAGK